MKFISVAQPYHSYRREGLLLPCPVRRELEAQEPGAPPSVPRCRPVKPCPWHFLALTGQPGDTVRGRVLEADYWFFDEEFIAHMAAETGPQCAPHSSSPPSWAAVCDPRTQHREAWRRTGLRPNPVGAPWPPDACASFVAFES